MSYNLDFKKASFLIYGLGSTGISVVKYFKKKKIKNFYVWDDSLKLRRKFYLNKINNLKTILNKVDFIVLSPGVSLKTTKYKKDLIKHRKKIITDIDLLYLRSPKIKSIVVTGSNGKSTTCKIITHLLKKNKFQVALGGNIGNPVLNIQQNKKNFFVIEASSFQLSHSKFIHPDYAILLNITNDHLDWHGSKRNYINSKFKIFKLQEKDDFALTEKKFQQTYRKKKYLGKLILSNIDKYIKIKSQIQNDYLTSSINDENMSLVFALSKLLKINKKSFITNMGSFSGLPHRYEIFLKRKNVTFINDSKATNLEAAKFALLNSKNIYWIVGGLPKDKDRIVLNDLKKKIIKSYIIGKNINFFKKLLNHKVKFVAPGNLKKAIICILKDIALLKKRNNTILFSPGAASFDQFKNFEIRGNLFKRLSRMYAKKFI